MPHLRVLSSRLGCKEYSFLNYKNKFFKVEEALSTAPFKVCGSMVAHAKNYPRLSKICT